MIRSLFSSSDGTTMCSTGCVTAPMSTYSVISFSINDLLNRSAKGRDVGINVDPACYEYMREVAAYFAIHEIQHAFAGITKNRRTSRKGKSSDLSFYMDTIKPIPLLSESA